MTNHGYKELSLSERRNQVLKAIRKRKNQGYSSIELVDVLHWPINCISNRMSELKKMGLLERSGKYLNPHSRVHSIRWRAI